MGLGDTAKNKKPTNDDIVKYHRTYSDSKISTTPV